MMKRPHFSDMALPELNSRVQYSGSCRAASAREGEDDARRSIHSTRRPWQILAQQQLVAEPPGASSSDA